MLYAELTPSRTGFQITLRGLMGVSIGWVSDQLNMLGLVAGIDKTTRALKIPGWGRVGLPTSMKMLLNDSCGRVRPWPPNAGEGREPGYRGQIATHVVQEIPMKAKFVFLALGLAVAGTAFVPTGPVEAKGVCSTKHGKGWAPTQDMAKFQAWEIVAQTTR